MALKTQQGTQYGSEDTVGDTNGTEDTVGDQMALKTQ